MDQESKARNSKKTIENPTPSRQNLLLFWDKRKRHQIIIPALVCLFFMILGFQNCKKGTRPNPSLPTPNPSQSEQGESPVIITHLGDKAIFKLENPSNKNISHILWRIIPRYCRYEHRRVITSTDSTLEMNWNDIVSSFLTTNPSGEITSSENFSVEAFIQLEEQDQCFIYRKNHVNFGNGGVLCTLELRSSDTLYILSKLSSDSSYNADQDNDEYKYFSVEDSVDLKFYQTDIFKPRVHGDIGELGISFNTFQWSIKKLFLEDPTELADQTHTSESLTQTFSQIGLYKASVNASGTNTYFDGIADEVLEEEASETLSTELMIGRCDESDTFEIVLDPGSFGTATPQTISDIEPVWNYVRPADSDANHTIQLTWIEDRSVYKYKRTSSTKFIEINILKADECFFDNEPRRQTCNTTTQECPDEEPNCNNISCVYEIRENLSPLPSCSGKVYEMGTLDIDMTKCTDDIFVVAASTSIEGQEVKPQTTFYKHCPANSEYCYFGEQDYRPDDHHCGSSP